MQVHNYYVGEWVSACGGGRVFADVGLRVWLCACVCVGVCACECACESLRASALVTQLIDLPLLCSCTACPVLTAFFT